MSTDTYEINTYDIGDKITLKGTFMNKETGELADPGEAKCWLLRPSGEVEELTTDQQSAGVYTAEHTCDESGQHVYAFDGDGGDIEPTAGERRFRVRRQRVPRT